MKALSITTDGTKTVVDIHEGDGCLADLQHHVGGWIEAVDLAPTVVLWLNEEGKLQGLPLNDYATRLTRGILSPFDLIVGDVIITGFDPATGDTRELSDEFIQAHTAVASI